MPNIGGIAAHVYGLSHSLVKSGNEVHIITFKDRSYDIHYEEIRNIKIHRISLLRAKYIGKLLYTNLITKKLMLLIRQHNIEVIHSHTLIPDNLALLMIRNTPKIITEHSSMFLRDVEKGKKIWLYRKLLDQADSITGPSKELVSVFNSIGINKEKTQFIPNGVDVSRFNPNVFSLDVKTSYKISPQELVILSPRRLVPKNGVMFLIRAMPEIIKEIPNVKCLIVGEGEEKKSLIQMASSLGVMNNIIFTGSIPYNNMPKFYAASDIVVLPSLKEATSIAGLEAMATGKPLIASKVGGLPYIIEDGKTGFLVQPRHSQSLASAIIHLLNNGEKIIKMGVRAREKAVGEFSWKVISEKFYRLYDKSVT